MTLSVAELVLSGPQAALWRVRTVQCWKNEDGKRFVFADDLVEAVARS